MICKIEILYINCFPFLQWHVIPILIACLGIERNVSFSLANLTTLNILLEKKNIKTFQFNLPGKCCYIYICNIISDVIKETYR